jgi:hypothetical protein
MNTNALLQPLTNSDVSSLVSALANPSGEDAAKLAMLKMLVTASTNSKSLGLTSNDIFNALATGADGFADRSLYEALALETSLPAGSWGALLIQGAGIIQVIAWGKSAEAWLVANATTLETAFAQAITGNLASSAKTFLSMFGVGTSAVAKDSTGAVALNSLTMMATSQAPGLAMVLNNLSSKTAVSVSGAVGARKKQSASSSGSFSRSGSSSSSAAGSTSGSSGDMTTVGINSRRSLMRPRR